MYGSVALDGTTLQWLRNDLLRSSKHRHNAGEPARAVKHRKVTGQIDAQVHAHFIAKLQEVQQRFEENGTITNFDREMINVELRTIDRKFLAYQCNEMSRLSFNQWWQKRRAIDREVAAMCPRNGTLLMCYGGGINNEAVVRG